MLRTPVCLSPNLVPWGSDPFVQRRRSPTSGRIRKKKHLYDWPIKSCSSYANFFANQKTVSKLVWFWQVICVHTNLIRLKTVKKNVYFDKFRNHATMTFCSKFPFGLFLKVISMLFFEEMLYIHLCYWTFQIFT